MKADTVVVGAGLAGSHIARQLASQGLSVHVIDAHAGVAAGQTGHLAAAMTPRISVDHNLRSTLSQIGIQYALSFWHQHVPADVFHTCGTVQRVIEQGVHKNLAKAAQCNEGAVLVSSAQATQLAGIELSEQAVWFATGTVVRIDRLVATLLQHPAIVRHQDRVQGLIPQSNGVLIQGQQADYEAQQVVLAASADTLRILETSQLSTPTQHPKLHTLHALTGQVMYVPETQFCPPPQRIVAGNGYCLPALDGVCVVGGTYEHGAKVGVHQAGQDKIRQKMPPILAQQLSSSLYPGWSGVRPVVRDRLPVVGPLPEYPQILLATGFASHGLSWAALVAALIAGYIQHEPLDYPWLSAIGLR